MTNLQDSQPTIKTATFSLLPGIIARHAEMQRAARYRLITIVILAGVTCYSLLYDIRVLFIAVVILFILIPTLKLFSYNDILTRPWAVNSIYPHCVTITSDGSIIVDHFPLPPKDDDERPLHHCPEQMTLTKSDINHCYFWHQYIVFIYHGHRELFIPLDSLNNPEDATAIIARFTPESRH
jgi:hypothetical protein